MSSVRARNTTRIFAAIILNGTSNIIWAQMKNAASQNSVNCCGSTSSVQYLNRSLFLNFPFPTSPAFRDHARLSADEGDFGGLRPTPRIRKVQAIKLRRAEGRNVGAADIIRIVWINRAGTA